LQFPGRFEIPTAGQKAIGCGFVSSVSAWEAEPFSKIEAGANALNIA